MESRAILTSENELFFRDELNSTLFPFTVWTKKNVVIRKKLVSNIS